MLPEKNLRYTYLGYVFRSSSGIRSVDLIRFYGIESLNVTLIVHRMPSSVGDTEFASIFGVDHHNFQRLESVGWVEDGTLVQFTRS